MVPPRILTGFFVILFIGSIHGASTRNAAATPSTLDASKVGETTEPSTAKNADAGKNKPKIRLVDAKARQDYAYAIFQPPSAVEGTGLHVVVFEVGKTEAKHAFKGELKVFVDMPGKSFTHYTNYTIRIVEKGAKTLDIPDMFFMSSPWNPGKVHGAKWSVTGEGENKAKISWEEPEQRNGPIDGYEYRHCLWQPSTPAQRGSTEAEQTEDPCPWVTVKGSLEAIVDVERNKQYRTDIRAYNLADLEYNESEKKRLQGEPDTIYPVNDKATIAGGGNSAAVAVLIVISVLLSLVIVGYAGYKYYRKNYN